MKALVFSDSHGKYLNIKNAIELHKSNTDAVIFLGDGIKDIERIKDSYPQIAFFIVKGNCDFMVNEYENERVITLGSSRVLICHGHTLNAKSTYLRLTIRAIELECDAVFFGHTHEQYDDLYDAYDKRVHLFNPGSIGYSGSYGIINTSGSVLVTSYGKIL
ncbi:MAG: YfcE family phosphodiesterase [Clostridia bacterium]|nr:YfcE family phosphodiesterase [Clostridia bacterium]